jgi:O-antigen/teichoic acid export membrane protein
MTTKPVAAGMAKGLTVLASSRGVVLGLQLVTISLLAGHLSPAGLGVFTFGVATANLFRFLPNFGLVQVLGRDIAQQPERERELLPNVVYLRLALGVLTYGLLGASLVLFGFDDAEVRAALIAGLILLIVIDSFRSSLEVRLRLGWVSIADTVEATATVIGAILLIRAGEGPEAFLWMYVVLKLVNAVMVWAAAGSMGEFSWRPRPALWPPLMRSALPLGLAGLLMALYFRLDVMILARLKPADDVGQYGAGYRFLEAFTVVPTMIMSVLAPVLARSFVEGAAVLQRRYGLAMHLVSVVAIGVSVGGAMTAWRVLPALPGFGEYDGGGVALSILSPAAGLILVGTIVQGALIAGHRQQRLLRISAAGLAANVALNLALIPSYSYIGAAIATTATEVLLVALSIREVRRRLSLRWPVTRMWPVVAAAVAMAAATALTYAVNPFLQVAIAAAVFLAVLAATGGLRPADLRPFRQVRA